MKILFATPSPLGTLILTQQNDALIALDFGFDQPPSPNAPPTALLSLACKELLAYFRSEQTIFTVPLNPSGTAFQKRCWQALCDIPYGQTISYAKQAQAIGNPRACRAVGSANHHNPIPILIPCHRVIGKNGQLTGYRGGVHMKQALLTLEQQQKED